MAILNLKFWFLDNCWLHFVMKLIYSNGSRQIKNRLGPNCFKYLTLRTYYLLTLIEYLFSTFVIYFLAYDSNTYFSTSHTVSQESKKY